MCIRDRHTIIITSLYVVHPCFSAAIVFKAVIFVERCSSSKDYITNGIYHNDYRAASGIHLVALLLMMSTDLSPCDKYSRPSIILVSRSQTLTPHAGGDFLSDVHFSNLVSARTTSILWACPTFDPDVSDPRDIVYTTYIFLEVLIEHLEPLQDGEWMIFFVKRRVSLQSG